MVVGISLGLVVLGDVEDETLLGGGQQLEVFVLLVHFHMVRVRCVH